MSRLSESKHPAYHLRPNKAVDRFLFLELLRTLELSNPLREYTYVGLGGPFLEDFRLMSQQFPQMKLICVEQDSETHKRQKFHLCSSKLECVHSPFGDYVANYFPTDRPVVTWADYTDMSRECLGEVGDIVRKSTIGSLLRVTVCAESPVPKKLGFSPFRYPPVVPKKRNADFERIKNAYSREMALEGIIFRPEWFQWKDFSVKEFPKLLARMIISVAEGSCSHPKCFIPLHNVKYSDGTIMLSVTGIIYHDAEREKILQHFIEQSVFCSKDSENIDEIDLPNLTTKERLHLDEILPTLAADGNECVDKLGYLIEGDESEFTSKKKMEQFEKYYRLYPYFGKIMP